MTDKTTEAIEYFQTLIDRLGASENQVCVTALEALREKAERDEPKPLTIEQMYDMDDYEPVYTTKHDGSGGVWGIMTLCEFGPKAYIPGETGGARYFHRGKTSPIAYRHKPRKD
jgi:hypothetical protein